MTQISQKSVISKAGINALKTLVEGKGSIFREINGQDDIGFDANIEFCVKSVDKYLPVCIEIKVQVKSGETYFNDSGPFIKGDKEHFDYWKNFNLPAFGVVYNPLTKNLYWVNITEYLLTTKNKGYNIPVDSKNVLNDDTFEDFMQYCIDYCMKDKNRFSTTKRLNDLYSVDTEVALSALLSLFLFDRNEKLFWNAILNYLYICNDKVVLRQIAYYLSIAIGDQFDVFWHENNTIDSSIANWLEDVANNVIDSILLYKILLAIKPHEDVDRGSIGNLIFIMIRKLQNRKKLLFEVFENQKNEFYIRDLALMYYLSEISKDEAIAFIDKQLALIDGSQLVLPLNVYTPVYSEFEEEFLSL